MSDARIHAKAVQRIARMAALPTAAQAAGIRVTAGRAGAGFDADRAITALYGTHYRYLVRLATLLVHDVPAAEEIVQDSFAAVHASQHFLADSDRALSYLRHSVVSGSRSLLRRPIPLQKAPQRAASAEDEGIAWMERSAVIEALRALPRRQREAVVLRYYGDLSDAQVAAAMGVSTGAAQRHAARAMAPMRAVLSRHDDDRAVEEHHYAPADSRTTQPPAPSA